MDEKEILKHAAEAGDRIAKAYNAECQRRKASTQVFMRKDILLAILATGAQFDLALKQAKTAIEFVNETYDSAAATGDLQAFFHDLESIIEFDTLYDGDGNERNQSLEQMLAEWWPKVKSEFARLVGLSADPISQVFGADVVKDDPEFA